MMTQPEIKSRLEFSSPEAWQAYVRTSVAVPERPFVFAFGQTTLYRRFYEVREQAFPVEFSAELKRIEGLDDPQRTEAIETLNGRIFADMNQFLMNAASRKAVPAPSETSPEGLEKLLVYLENENEAFALWLRYKRATSHQQHLPSWEEFVRTLLADTTEVDLEFVLMMRQLDELLDQFRIQRLVLSSRLFQRIRAIHREPAGSARVFLTRILLQELLEALTPCTSA
jgi:hypothetical protein